MYQYVYILSWYIPQILILFQMWWNEFDLLSSGRMSFVQNYWSVILAAKRTLVDLYWTRCIVMYWDYPIPFKTKLLQKPDKTISGQPHFLREISTAVRPGLVPSPSHRQFRLYHFQWYDWSRQNQNTLMWPREDWDDTFSSWLFVAAMW